MDLSQDQHAHHKCFTVVQELSKENTTIKTEEAEATANSKTFVHPSKSVSHDMKHHSPVCEDAVTSTPEWNSMKKSQDESIGQEISLGTIAALCSEEETEYATKCNSRYAEPTLCSPPSTKFRPPDKGRHHCSAQSHIDEECKYVQQSSPISTSKYLQALIRAKTYLGIVLYCAYIYDKVNDETQDM